MEEPASEGTWPAPSQTEPRLQPRPARPGTGQLSCQRGRQPGRAAIALCEERAPQSRRPLLRLRHLSLMEQSRHGQWLQTLQGAHRGLIDRQRTRSPWGTPPKAWGQPAAAHLLAPCATPPSPSGTGSAPWRSRRSPPCRCPHRPRPRSRSSPRSHSPRRGGSSCSPSWNSLSSEHRETMSIAGGTRSQQ